MKSFPSGSGSKNRPGIPYAFSCLCRESLATLVPAKVVGCNVDSFGKSNEPTDLWGDCGY